MGPLSRLGGHAVMCGHGEREREREKERETARPPRTLRSGRKVRLLRGLRTGHRGVCQLRGGGRPARGCAGLWFQGPERSMR